MKSVKMAGWLIGTGFFCQFPAYPMRRSVVVALPSRTPFSSRVSMTSSTLA